MKKKMIARKRIVLMKIKTVPNGNRMSMGTSMEGSILTIITNLHIQYLDLLSRKCPASNLLLIKKRRTLIVGDHRSRQSIRSLLN